MKYKNYYAEESLKKLNDAKNQIKEDWIECCSLAKEEHRFSIADLQALSRSFQETGNEYVAGKISTACAILQISAEILDDCINQLQNESSKTSKNSSLQLLACSLAGISEEGNALAKSLVGFNEEENS